MANPANKRALAQKEKVKNDFIAGKYTYPIIKISPPKHKFGRQIKLNMKFLHVRLVYAFGIFRLSIGFP
jgi:hypothetical protein